MMEVVDLQTFTALDLQQRSGELQRTAVAAPVIITHHGHPRHILMSVDEFRRLKAAAGEVLPRELTRRKPLVQHGLLPDRLGRDTSDFDTFLLDVVEHASSGQDREAIAEEIQAVERQLAGTRRDDHVRP